jgi:8-oxo-dGTP pyrophosphatase MutT (NUDIX family)
MANSLHPVQLAILKELLFTASARFSDLNVAGLTSDHFSFHIKHLCDLGLVSKSGQSYALTIPGKEFANRLDTGKVVIERQAKLSVKPVIVKTVGKKVLLLAQQRLKQPYYGLWGFPGGKIGWGETLFAACGRELLEETGLTGKMTFKGVQHKLDVTIGENRLLEDKYFFVVRVENPVGTFNERTPGCFNHWYTPAEIKTLERFDGVDEIIDMVFASDMQFVERNYRYDISRY